MVSLRYLKSYCSDYTQIENYDKAILDEDNIWQCHHIFHVAKVWEKSRR